jgi:hypothetical protein
MYNIVVYNLSVELTERVELTLLPMHSDTQPSCNHINVQIYWLMHGLAAKPNTRIIDPVTNMLQEQTSQVFWVHQSADCCSNANGTLQGKLTLQNFQVNLRPADSQGLG